jgi:hypothetical protein
MKREHKGLALGTAAVVALLAVFRHRIHFDVHSFAHQMRGVSAWHVAAGIAAIYAAFWVRSVRWALLLRPQKRVRAVEMLAPQLVGFTAVGLFGRLADLARPYIIAKQTDTAVSAQVAVYTVERIFDLGAAALVFSTATALVHTGAALPHAEAIARIGRGSLAATVALGVFAVALRVMGERIARMAERVVGLASAKLGAAVAARVREFREGLNVVTGAGEFALVAAYSVGMWGLIALAYVESVHSFVRTPALAAMTFAQVMVLMASSIAGSTLQLPVVGWFSQMAVVAAALTGIFGVPVETAAACGAVQFFVCSLSVIPAGLLCAQMGHVSLKQVAVESSEAERSTL